jgi:hypothetical protein
MAVTNYGDYDAWQRHALITIDDGTYHVDMHALTETIEIDIGERDLDVINLLNLGQIPKHGNIGLTTVTFEGYAKEAGTSDASGSAATGVFDIFAYKPTRYLTGGTDTDLGEAQEIPITNHVARYRVAILWTNDGAATAGDSAVTSGTTYFGKRFVIADCFCVGYKESFTDGVLKYTLTFKGTAFDASGNARIEMQSVDATATALSALGNYTPGAADPF